MEKYFLNNSDKCTCGIVHFCPAEVYMGSGAIANLSDILSSMEAKRVYVLSDKNTYAVAGERVERILADRNIPYFSFTFENSPHPDDEATYAAKSHCPEGADLIIGIPIAG